MSSPLYGLPDDVVIYKLMFLPIPDILRLRQTCQRFNALTRLPIVWKNAFELDILANDYPFDTYDIDIEHRTCQAYQRASRWLADSSFTPKIETILVKSFIQQTTFIPGRQHKFLLTVNNTVQIQRLLTIWDTTRQKKSSEWSWKAEGSGMVVVNTDGQSEATLAVPSHRPQGIVLLHLDDDGILHEIHTIDMDLYPVTLTGDIIALCDRHNKFRTLVYNWKTSARACLEFVGDVDPGECDHHVVFAPSTILVVHTTYVNLFRMPSILDGRTLSPIATHFFGITNGSSAPSPAPGDPHSILIRPDRPDTDDPQTLELYSLSSFPPILTSTTPDLFINFVLGRRSTAIGVRYSGKRRNNKLIAFAFPGPLNHTSEVRVHEVLCPLGKNWTPLDYDEDLGRIALMSGDGPRSRLMIIHI